MGLATLEGRARWIPRVGGILTLLASQPLEKVVGAHLLVPNLVAIVVTRELGVLLTGIALAGREASAHAAEFARFLLHRGAGPGR
jgi:ABC-type transporter Mla maintaining outer membrane lipid asymmetry permease subunit MlaE